MPKTFKTRREKQTYQSWSDMRSRCKNRQHARYHNYGGAGIKVCDRWDSFELFKKDMGLKPEGLSLGRKDKREGYNPKNCEWMSYKANNFNKRDTTRLTYAGRTQSIDEWAQEIGIPRSTLSNRIHIFKWPVELALTAPKNYVVNMPADPEKQKFISPDRLDPDTWED